jgi:hypothetical protein
MSDDKILVMNNLTTANPYTIGSSPDFLTGYAVYGSGTFQITNSVPKTFRASNAALYDQRSLTATNPVIRSTVVLVSGSSWGGAALIDSATGNGYYAQQDCTANKLYLFKLVAGAQGAQIGAFVANTEVTGMSIGLERNNSNGNMGFYVDGVSVGGVYNDTTYTPNKAAAISQGMDIRSLTSSYTPNQTVTFATNLTPGASRTDTCTGYLDGAAVISFAGVTAAVTITSGSFTWTVPAMAGGVVWPRLPATGATITLTQGALNASALANITLPSGAETLRAGDTSAGAVSNFVGIITDSDQFIGYHITLLTTDTAYFTTSGGYWISRSGAVQSTVVPRTDTFLLQHSDGSLISHSVTLNAVGEIVPPVSGSNKLSVVRLGALRLSSLKLTAYRI